ncbi:tRNA (uracil-O(2)-)-methyltransferase [Kalmanozyma brasiliensis GHG001]|uniref:tRNA (uracil-O(2)-)-methyltransferase n=1 Tax=Kalmanozyma brasiliensis (strain GHG001) TaxID=1365824 RepID=V5ENF1_KALBG|nr:tRNA (uracil-O(2)-)-methyltransferase [Kalmanozyma brasiliensis GHG001]EST06610.1 tRNA (uracil-O(2)-)-methyltransferase [Kalmanozyma brasiliensis GHG001]
MSGIESDVSPVAGSSSTAPTRTTVQHQQLPPRPKLVLTYPSAEVRTRPSSSRSKDDEEYVPYELSGLTPLSTHEEGEDWVSIISAPAHAPIESWLHVMQSLIRHPERTSSNILRAGIVAETNEDASTATLRGKGWKKQWTIRRELVPRRPNLDWRMEQDCSLFYRYSLDEEHEDEPVEAVIVYTPLIGDTSHAKIGLSDSNTLRGQPPSNEALIPFYHPKVRALAFHFHPSSHPTPLPTDSNDGEPTFGTLSISLIPFSPSPPAFSPTHRLTRVAHSLLTTLHMHTWGHRHDYTKRVHHDTLVPRTLYQDTYLALKVRYAGELIAGWAEATDPRKHVFEEMGIAAFLIGLWSLHYGGEEGWKGKVRFVDVGCGNGLLTYILMREGFQGIGLDLRKRKSWANFTAQGARLEEWNFNPSSLLTESAEQWKGAWLLGNHADQLTPWIPVLATHCGAQGFINLPCCYYALDGSRNFDLTLRGDVSRNEQYLAYVRRIQERFAWKVELDPLRIPSTKNWCFVGRTREKVDEEVLRERVKTAVEEALRTGWAVGDPTTT